MSKFHPFQFVSWGIVLCSFLEVHAAEPTFSVSGKVLDAVSGEPVERFTIDFAMWDPDDVRVHWNKYVIPGTTVAHEKPGEYAFHFTPKADRLHLRFIAAGYESFVSRKILPGEGPITLDVRLKRLPDDGTAEIRGQVLTPGKRPAAWTKIGIAKSGQYSNIWVNDGKLGGVPGPSAYTEADEEGRFAFALQPHGMKPGDPYCIVFVHEAGFAEIDGPEFDAIHRQYATPTTDATADSAEQGADMQPEMKPADSDKTSGRPVVLTPWGRIEGTVSLTGQTGSIRDVRLTMDDFRPAKDKQRKWDSPNITYSYTAKTDTQAQFVFERVPPKRGRLSVEDSYAGGYAVAFLRIPVEVEPGKTANAVIGGIGRPVIGRLLLPDGFESDHSIDWKNASVVLSPVTPRKDVVQCGATVDSDSRFRIPNVPAGRWALRAVLLKPLHEVRGPMSPVAGIRKEIEVPETPYDLGELTLEPAKSK